MTRIYKQISKPLRFLIFDVEDFIAAAAVFSLFVFLNVGAALVALIVTAFACCAVKLRWRTLFEAVYDVLGIGVPAVKIPPRAQKYSPFRRNHGIR